MARKKKAPTPSRATLLRNNRKLTKQVEALKLQLTELQVIEKQISESLKERDNERDVIVSSKQKRIDLLEKEQARLGDLARRCTAWGQFYTAVIGLLPKGKAAALRLLVKLLGLNRSFEMAVRPEHQPLGEFLTDAIKEVVQRNPDWEPVHDARTEARREHEAAQADASKAADARLGLAGDDTEQMPGLDADKLREQARSPFPDRDK